MAPIPQPVTAPPVPTRIPIAQPDPTTGYLIATPTWIQWFINLGKQFGFFQTIQSNGTNLPQELGLNFLSPLTATDNPANGTIDVGYASPGVVASDVTGSRNLGSTYTATVSIAVSAQARQTASSGGDNKIQGLSDGLKVGGNTTSSTIVGAILSSFFLVQAGKDYSTTVTALSGSSTWVVDSWIEWPI